LVERGGDLSESLLSVLRGVWWISLWGALWGFGDSLWGFVNILASTTSIRPLHAYHLNIEGYTPALLCRNLLISRYSLSNRRYIEIIADILK